MPGTWHASAARSSGQTAKLAAISQVVTAWPVQATFPCYVKANLAPTVNNSECLPRLWTSSLPYITAGAAEDTGSGVSIPQDSDLIQAFAK